MGLQKFLATKLNELANNKSQTYYPPRSTPRLSELINEFENVQFSKSSVDNPDIDYPKPRGSR